MLDNFLNQEIKVTQVKSGLKLTARQKGNLTGLGLRGIGSSFSLKGTPSILGMVKKVNHVIKIELA